MPPRTTSNSSSEANLEPKSPTNRAKISDFDDFLGLGVLISEKFSRLYAVNEVCCPIHCGVYVTLVRWLASGLLDEAYRAYRAASGPDDLWDDVKSQVRRSFLKGIWPHELT